MNGLLGAFKIALSSLTRGLDDVIDTAGAVYVAAAPALFLVGTLTFSAVSGCLPNAVSTAVLQQDTLITTSTTHIWTTVPTNTPYGVKYAYEINVDVTAPLVQLKYPRGTLFLRKTFFQLHPDGRTFAYVAVSFPNGEETFRIIDNSEFNLLLEKSTKRR